MRPSLLLVAFLLTTVSFSQKMGPLSVLPEQELETHAEKNEGEIENDDYLQRLQRFASQPLDLNEASADDLLELLLVTDVQVKNFMQYRRLFGKLIDIYELQAVPGWDISSINKLQPYITVNKDKGMIENVKERWNDGEHSLLFRSSRVLEKAKGFEKPLNGDNYYTGGRDRIFIRYKYRYKNQLQWGVLGEKDAGEPFFKGTQKAGFDFYSFHLFLKGSRFLKTLALGDFTVNMGQGLIQWQGLAFNKSAEVLTVKRQSPVLSAYNSSGEFNFYRGIGITFQKRKWEGTGFISLRRMSGNKVVDSLSVSHISSLISSGYHRTPAELADRNDLQQFTAGGSIAYRTGIWHLAANAVNYLFSLPLLKADEPYHLFAIKGRAFSNVSIDYSYTFKNLHFFGETALDKGMHAASLNGLLISFDSKVDAAFVLRSIDKKYQSLYSNAFTENTFPTNENGLYAGVSIRPSSSLTIDAYSDVFSFPWLKYRVDAPSAGNEYLLQFTYKPGKNVEFYSRIKNEVKSINRSGNNLATSIIDRVIRQNFRIQSSLLVNRMVTLRHRCEISWYNKKEPTEEQGFLISMDCLLKPPKRPWSANLRLLYFETGGYDSRIYAYENDVPYVFSIPAFFDKGFRYYVNLGSGPKRFLKKGYGECWLRWAQTLAPERKEMGSGLNAISGNKETEIKFEIMFRL